MQAAGLRVPGVAEHRQELDQIAVVEEQHRGLATPGIAGDCATGTAQAMDPLVDEHRAAPVESTEVQAPLCLGIGARPVDSTTIRPERCHRFSVDQAEGFLGELKSGSAAIGVEHAIGDVEMQAAGSQPPLGLSGPFVVSALGIVDDLARALSVELRLLDGWQELAEPAPLVENQILHFLGLIELQSD